MYDERVAQLEKALSVLLTAVHHEAVVLEADGGLPQIDYHRSEFWGTHPDFICRGGSFADGGEFKPSDCPVCAALAALENREAGEPDG